MGIMRTYLHLLLKEHVTFPVKDRVVTLGQQTVLASMEDVQSVFRLHGCPSKPLPPDFDTRSRTISSPYADSIDGRTLFMLLGADSVHVLDLSEYEGADIIWDLNSPVPDDLHNQFDVVFDAGTLEHVFDLPTALASLVNMCSLGGIIILFNPSSGMVDHGFYSISPTLYYDYFRANGFGDFSCYLLEGQQIDMKMKVYKYQRPNLEIRTSFCEGFDVAFFCRKLQEVPTISKPVQTLFQKLYAETPEHVDSAKHRRSLITAAKMFVRGICPDWLFHQWVQRRNGRGQFRTNVQYIGRF